jgi:hypothetical protein
MVMAGEDKTDAEKKESADEIKRVEASDHAPRGGAHGRKDDARLHDAPPPLPN